MKGVFGAVRCKPVRECRPSFRRVWRTFITNSIRLPVNQTCAIVCAEFPHLEQLARNPCSSSSKYSGPSRPHSHPHSRTSFSALLGIPRYPSLTPFAHLRSAPLTNGKVQSPNSSHGFWVDWNLFYWHQSLGDIQRGGSDLTGVHIFLWCKNQSCFLCK